MARVGALAELEPLPDRFDETLGGVLSDTEDLAFACQMYPRTCEPDALATVVAAVHEHCDAPTAAFLTACQILRALSILRARRPEWVEHASRRMQSTFVGWRT